MYAKVSHSIDALKRQNGYEQKVRIIGENKIFTCGCRRCTALWLSSGFSVLPFPSGEYGAGSVHTDTTRFPHTGGFQCAFPNLHCILPQVVMWL